MLPPPDSPGCLRARLGDSLPAAMKERDQVAVAAIRSALAAIANAEAVDDSPVEAPTTSPHVAGAVTGLGAAEVARRELTEADIRGIVLREAVDRESAAAVYDERAEPARAARLRAEAAYLRAAAR